MSAVDTAIAIRIIYLIVTPFEKWEACALGVIDDDGKLLIQEKDRTTEMRNAWTMLHRLVWKLKLILAKIPGGSTQFGSIAAAYLLVKESIDNDKEPNNLYECFQNKIHNIDTSLIEEMGATIAGVMATGAENADKPEILNKKKMIRRFKDVRKEKVNVNC
jgi:hypothetical protein